MPDAEHFDPKAKYALMYAADVTKPPGDAPAAMRQFRSRWALAWFAIRDEVARRAVLAGRFHFIVFKSDDAEQ